MHPLGACPRAAREKLPPRLGGSPQLCRVDWSQLRDDHAHQVRRAGEVDKQRTGRALLCHVAASCRGPGAGRRWAARRVGALEL